MLNVAEPLLIARNPDPESSLPYIVRIPLGDGIILRTRETWPRTAKVYCHRDPDGWPAEPDIVEEVPLRSVTRRGPAIDLVADRTREARSQFVITRARGREMIFWLPTARAAGLAELTILVDTRERYAWKFSHQQATTDKQTLAVGDYAVEHDGEVVAVVERKSLGDLTSSLTSGKLGYRVAELAECRHAAVVVEDRYSAIFTLDHVRPVVVAEMLAELQVRHSAVPIVFAENRALAQEWTSRFLGAALLASQQADSVSDDFTT